MNYKINNNRKKNIFVEVNLLLLEKNSLWIGKDNCSSYRFVSTSHHRIASCYFPITACPSCLISFFIILSAFY